MKAQMTKFNIINNQEYRNRRKDEAAYFLNHFVRINKKARTRLSEIAKKGYMIDENGIMTIHVISIRKRPTLRSLHFCYL